MKKKIIIPIVILTVAALAFVVPKHFWGPYQYTVTVDGTTFNGKPNVSLSVLGYNNFVNKMNDPVWIRYSYPGYDGCKREVMWFTDRAVVKEGELNGKHCFYTLVGDSLVRAFPAHISKLPE